MRQDTPPHQVDTTTEEMMSWISEIVALGIRRPGYPAALRAEDYIAEKFQRFGIEQVEKEPVPVNLWFPEKTSVSLGDEREPVECAGIPYTAWTPAEGIQAPLLYWGEGSADEIGHQEVDGKIVVLEARFGDLSGGALKGAATGIFDPDNTIPDGVLHTANWLIKNFPVYYEAWSRGAAGFIGLLVDAPIDGCSYYVPYDGFMKQLPGLWVGRDNANRVREAAQKGETARILSTGKGGPGNSHNVVGWVPGKGNETILLTSHHDAPFASAVEDGSGIALLLALAKTFGKREGDLNRNLVFVAASGHFHGGIGNRKFVETHPGEELDSIIAALGMEHIAHEVESDGRGGYRLTGLPEVRALFAEGKIAELLAEGVAKWGLDRSLIVPPYLFGPEPPCDSAPYFTVGIPSGCLISGPLYLFDEFDTLDKVRQQDLLPAASMFADLVMRIDKLPREVLEAGLSRKRTDPPAEPAHWFMPPDTFLRKK
jgi:hypothetical protein